MFFNNYSRPGKGIEKRNPNQPRIQIFFEILPMKLWKILKLNLLYLVTSIPFFAVTMIVLGIISSNIIQQASVTESVSGNINYPVYDVAIRFFLSFLFMFFLGQGPTTTGYTYILREYGRELPCWPVADYFGTIKKNLKQSILLWILDLTVVSVLMIAFFYYSKMGIFVFQALAFMALILYLMIHIYIYQMLITFDISLKNIVKNSLLIAMAKLPSSLVIMAICFLVYAVLPFLILMNSFSIIAIFGVLILEFFVLPGIICFAINFYIYPILDQYINLEKMNKTKTQIEEIAK